MEGEHPAPAGATSRQRQRKGGRQAAALPVRVAAIVPSRENEIMSGLRRAVAWTAELAKQSAGLALIVRVALPGLAGGRVT